MLKINIGADHAGFELKEWLKAFLEKSGYSVYDSGAFRLDPKDDFPDFAKAVCREVAKHKRSVGILICGSGQGMAMSANKIKGIRAAVCWDLVSVTQAREHLDINVLCLGENFVTKKLAERITEAFLTTRFSREKRHVRRIKKIQDKAH